MPKFMYTIFVISGVAWLSFYRFITHIPPDSYFRIVLFNVLLILSLTLTFSIPIYFYFHYKAPTFTNLRFLYRKSLRWSLFFAAGIVFVVVLKIFELDTPLNLILFGLFYVLLYMQLKPRG